MDSSIYVFEILKFTIIMYFVDEEPFCLSVENADIIDNNKRMIDL